MTELLIVVTAATALNIIILVKHSIQINKMEKMVNELFVPLCAMYVEMKEKEKE